jgi:acetyl-CoA carboxylase carboxyl transferase subunit alpha
MLENSIYSILSPEGYASILWKDSSRAKEAAEVMKLTAKDLYELKVIDKIVKETGGFEETAVKLHKEIVKNIKEMQKQTKEEIIEQRYQKFRNMGEYELQIKANS